MVRRFYITDVFCEGRYSGNQLATVIDTVNLNTDEMQKIAREFNFSETTFVTGGDLENGFDVRIFTPTAELPFAGHPTLGSAYLIRNHIEKLDVNRIELNLGVGKIPVTFASDGVLWMKQRDPEFGKKLSAAEVADALGLSLEDIDVNFPIQFVSTGLEFLIVPLTSMSALKRSFVKRSLGFGTFVFSREPYSEDQLISSRMFARGAGIEEDPATGSANGCLASYLVEYEYFGNNEIDIKVGQGYEIQRPSTLYLQARKVSAEFDINVGGRVRLAASGKLY